MKTSHVGSRKFLASALVLLVCFFNGSVRGAGGYKPLKVFGDFSKSSSEPVGSLIEGTNGILYGLSRQGGAGGCGTVFQMEKGTGNLQVLRSFSPLNADGRAPGEGVTLLLATNGMLYGTTSEGGSGNFGTIFRIAHDGSGYEILRSFSGGSEDGAVPFSGLIQASNGLLYGTTSAGGSYGGGTVFRINPDGSDYLVINSFGVSPSDGSYPVAPLAEGTNSILYGTTMLGGAAGKGTIFSIDPDTGLRQLLKYFMDVWGDGSRPRGGLLLGQDGTFYGSTYSGGNSGLGTLFALRHDGSFYRVFYQFTQGRGANPKGELIQDSAGILYGVTEAGGVSTNGTVFQIQANGASHTIINSYAEAWDGGAHPTGALLLASDGSFYGLARDGGFGIYGPASGQGIAFRLDYDAGVFNRYNLIWNFSGAGGDAVDPQSGLVESTNGRLYGITISGGSFGQGTVFGINKDGTGYEILKAFSGGDDGACPIVQIVIGSDGYLYGSTSCGQQRGLPGGWSRSGGGNIFRIRPDGTAYQILMRSTAAGIVEAANGMLYGTSGSQGRLFRMNRDGSGFTWLTPSATPTPSFQGNDGALYGISQLTISRINLDGSGFQMLKTFPSSLPYLPDATDWIDVTQGSDGMLYGVSRYISSRGGVFCLDPVTTAFTTLTRFSGNPFNLLERYPIAHPILARNGTLYGTTGLGDGADKMGTIYQVYPDGTGYRVLHAFHTNGVIFPGHLLEGSDGHLYGIAPARQGKYGAVFAFEPPPVLQLLECNGNDLRLRILGIPNGSCMLQRSETMLSGWVDVGTIPLDGNGKAEFVHHENGTPAAFYRALAD